MLIITTGIYLPLSNNGSDNSSESLNTSYKVTDKKEEIKSIAQPNWWLKPAITDQVKTPHNKNKRVNDNAEPVTNFLMIPKMDEWQLQEKTEGIASATYQLTNKGNELNGHHQLAVIRMNAQVALDAVLNIWKDKAGLTSDITSEPVIFMTNKKQQLELYTFKGLSKTILVAVHKGKKHTFFRLSDVLKIEQKSSETLDKQAEITFHNFLSEIFIFN